MTRRQSPTVIKAVLLAHQHLKDVDGGAVISLRVLRLAIAYEAICRVAVAVAQSPSAVDGSAWIRKRRVQIYRGNIALNRAVITYVIPFAFTAYFPASYILRGGNPLWCVGMTVPVAAALMALGVFVWHRGIRAYESAGS